MVKQTSNYEIKTGFTLAQLLIVIAIIAIVASVLCPIFFSVREYARGATCTSNEKRIGLAFFAYAQDNDKYLPSGRADVEGAGWAGEIYPYVKSTETFRCPDDTSYVRVRTVHASRLTYACYPVSYSYNRNLEGIGVVGIHGVVARMSQPNQTVMLTEVSACNQDDFPNQYNVADLLSCNEAGGGLDSRGVVSYSSASTGTYAWNGSGRTLLETGIGVRRWAPETFSSLTGRHRGGAIYLLADGHVRWAKANRVSTGPIYNKRANSVCIERRTSNQDENITACGETSAGTASTQNWLMTFSPI